MNKRCISTTISTSEVTASASMGQHATLEGCYGWIVLIGLGVTATDMGVHSKDYVILQSWMHSVESL